MTAHRPLLFLLPVLLFVSQAAAQDFGPNVRINDDHAGANQRAPVLRIGSDGTLYVAWIDYRSNPGGDIYFSKSTDGGITFSKNVAVSSGGSVNSDFQRTAYFAVDSRAGLHFVWMQTRSGNQPDIFYARSTDGGATFSPPVSLSGDSSKYAQDFPSIAVDASDNIFVCFLDSREVQSGRSKNVQLYFTRSTDGGVTFAQPYRISNMPFGEGGTCECCRTDLAVSPGGNVYAAFRSNINDRRDIFIARSRDKGLTFEEAIPVPGESWIIGGCPVTGPSIALDREENAHVVWIDARPSAGSSSFVYYGMLPVGGTSCLPDMRISDAGRNGNYPDVKISPDGVVLCAYQESRGDPMDLFFRVSRDGGNTFTPSRKLTDETVASRQEFVSCVMNPQGGRYAVWQDGRRDAGDIFFARDTTALQAVPPGRVPLVSPPDGATMNSFRSFVWRRPANLGPALRTKYDVTWRRKGNPPATFTTFDTSASPLLIPGEYTWDVRARSPAGTSSSSDTGRFTLGSSSGIGEKILRADPDLDVYPHPVAGYATVSVGMPRRGYLRLTLADVLGREIRMIALEQDEAGRHTFPLERRSLPAGLYFLRLLTIDGASIRRLVFD